VKLAGHGPVLTKREFLAHRADDCDSQTRRGARACAQVAERDRQASRRSSTGASVRASPRGTSRACSSNSPAIERRARRRERGCTPRATR
jgi:hypothetical protein